MASDCTCYTCVYLYCNCIFIVQSTYLYGVFPFTQLMVWSIGYLSLVLFKLYKSSLFESSLPRMQHAGIMRALIGQRSVGLEPEWPRKVTFKVSYSMHIFFSWRSRVTGHISVDHYNGMAPEWNSSKSINSYLYISERISVTACYYCPLTGNHTTRVRPTHQIWLYLERFTSKPLYLWTGQSQMLLTDTNRTPCMGITAAPLNLTLSDLEMSSSRSNQSKLWRKRCFVPCNSLYKIYWLEFRNLK